MIYNRCVVPEINDGLHGDIFVYKNIRTIKMKSKPKLIRITTVPISLKGLQRGQHKYMSQNGFEVLGVSSPGVALDDVTRDEGIRTVAVEMRRRPCICRDVCALVRLIRLFRKEKPDIVHSHTPKAGLLAMMAARVAGVKHRLHTVAGMPLTVTTGAQRKILDLTETVTYKCATMVYPNSYGLQEIILENGYTQPEKLKIIGNGSSNGVDTSEFDPASVSAEVSDAIRRELGIGGDDFVFLFVGRVVGDKGVNELVAAFDNVAKNHEGVHLIVVGGEEIALDPLRAETKRVMSANKRIHTVGYRENVKDYFAASDLFVFPSYREGFPNVVMQAAAMQLNCVVSDINGCNEIITDGENGWVVPVRNVEQLQQRMEWAVENREASAAMGLKSRRLMMEKYERKYVQGELLREYLLLMNNE